jgi:chitinase
VAAATTPVTAPGILAPADVVVGAADGYIDLPVTLTAPGVNSVTVQYSTYNGTTSGSTGCWGTAYGFVGQSGTLTFEPGVTTQTIRVPLLNCGVSLTSGFQEFTLGLSGNSADSTIARGITQIDITETP